MKALKAITFLTIMGSLMACQEEIDLNLNEAASNIVIQANINDLDKEQVIFIGKTVNFDGETKNDTLESPAEVYVLENGSEDKKHVFVQKEQTASNAYFSTFTGKPGIRYDLVVKAGGKTYTSSSIMPARVVLDSISITTLTFFDESKKYVKLHYQDPEQEQNAYRSILKINNAVVKQPFVDNDRFNNGKYINVAIYHEEPDIVTGDEISIDFQTIDQNIYRYFFSLSQISGGGGPPTAPSNPPSNITNGALGYFNAHTSQKRSFEVNN